MPAPDNTRQRVSARGNLQACASAREQNKHIMSSRAIACKREPGRVSACATCQRSLAKACQHAPARAIALQHVSSRAGARAGACHAYTSASQFAAVLSNARKRVPARVRQRMPARASA